MSAAYESRPFGIDEHYRRGSVEIKFFFYEFVLFVGQIYGSIRVGEQSLYFHAFEKLRIFERNIAVAA